MDYQWQRPISQEGQKGWERAHLIPVSRRKDQLLPALCGKLFNPGFARRDNKSKHCFNCERRLK